MINLKILAFNKKEDNIILIGKTGVLRIKSKLASHLVIDNKDKWIFGIDEQEPEPPKHVYLIRVNNINTPAQGKKMIKNNSGWSIDANPFISEYGIPVLTKLKVEVFNDRQNRCLRIFLPKGKANTKYN